MKKSYGNPVSGDRFFDRQKELQALLEVIDEGGHRYLSAQRRMGKSSLAQEVCHRLRLREDYVTLFADIEHADRPEDVVKEILMVTRPFDSLWKKALRPFNNIFSAVIGGVQEVSVKDFAIKVRSGINAGNWMDKGDKLFAVMANYDKRVLLVIDELSIFLIRLMEMEKNDYRITPEGRHKADLFMHWLRKNAQEHNQNVSILILSSIGLAPILRRAGLSAVLGAFPTYHLNPWDQETTCNCLNALATEYDIILGEEACIEIYRLLGCGIPHYVQLFFDQLHLDAGYREAGEITVTDVNRIYKKVLLSTRGSTDLEHYEARLKMALGRSRYVLALDLLTEVARGDNLNAETLACYQEEFHKQFDNVEEVITDILFTLEQDGYLHPHEDGYVFAFKLLEEWWRGRYSRNFTPIRKRRV